MNFTEALGRIRYLFIKSHILFGTLKPLVSGDIPTPKETHDIAQTKQLQDSDNPKPYRYLGRSSNGITPGGNRISVFAGPLGDPANLNAPASSRI